MGTKFLRSKAVRTRASVYMAALHAAEHPSRLISRVRRQPTTFLRMPTKSRLRSCDVERSGFGRASRSVVRSVACCARSLRIGCCLEVLAGATISLDDTEVWPPRRFVSARSKRRAQVQGRRIIVVRTSGAKNNGASPRSACIARFAIQRSAPFRATHSSPARGRWVSHPARRVVRQNSPAVAQTCQIRRGGTQVAETALSYLPNRQGCAHGGDEMSVMGGDAGVSSALNCAHRRTAISPGSHFASRVTCGTTFGCPHEVHFSSRLPPPT